MANREYVPPPLYGPTPPSPDQVDREAGELVQLIQAAMSKRQVTDPVANVDPWELLRELRSACGMVSSKTGLGMKCAQIDESLKQHDAEKAGNDENL